VFESRQRVGIYLFTTASRPALRPTQPPIQWVSGTLSLGVKRPRCEGTTHLHLVPRLRMHGAIPPLAQYAFKAWCKVQGPNIHLSTLFSNTLNPCSSLSVRGQVSHPYETRGKMMIFMFQSLYIYRGNRKTRNFEEIGNKIPQI
jgi:hypothetical protein